MKRATAVVGVSALLIGTIAIGSPVVGSQTGTASAAPTVTRVELPTLGGDSTLPKAANDVGQVVGESEVTPQGDRHPFSWTEAGGIIDIGTAGGPAGWANSVNDAGVVVGATYTAGYEAVRAFRWTEAGGRIDLPGLGGSVDEAVDVNASGVAVGFVTTADGSAQHAALWDETGSFTDLGTLGGSDSRALAISDDGTVVGYSFTGPGVYHAFAWTEAGGMVDLGVPSGGSASVATAIGPAGLVVGFAWVGNHSRPVVFRSDLGVLELDPLSTSAQIGGVSTNGQVVGWHQRASAPADRAFSWTEGGGLVELGDLGGSYSYAKAVNASGHIVGNSTIAGDHDVHAFWSNGTTMVDLVADAPTVYSDAIAIDSSGRIVGSVTDSLDFTTTGVVWTVEGDVDPPGDITDPTIDVTAPTDGATVEAGASLAATFSCADEVGGSGLASCEATQGSNTAAAPNSLTLDTATLGPKGFTVTAIDVAGNSATTTITYTVVMPQFAVDAPESPAPAGFSGPAGDFDGDGLTDVLSVSTTGLALSLGRLDGTFVAGPISPYNGTGVRWDFAPRSAGDLDGDGDLDLVLRELVCTSCSIGGNARYVVAFNDGGGSFTTATAVTEQFTVAAGTAGRILALGDVDGDGDLDIVQRRNDRTSPSATNVLSIEVRLNSGTGTFAAPANLGPVGSATDVTTFSMVVTDADGDGTDDIVTLTGGTLRAVFAGGIASALGGSPATVTTLGTVPSNTTLFGAADITGDFVDDLVGTAPGAIVYVPGAGGGTFGALRVAAMVADTLLVSPTTVDIDADGDLDVAWILRNTPNLLRLALNDGYTQLQQVEPIGLPPAADQQIFIDGVSDLGAGPHGLIVTRALSSPTVVTTVLRVQGTGVSSSDADGDGVVDSLQPSGTPAGGFRDAVAGSPDTTGSIVSVPAGMTVTVSDAPDPAGVAISVGGSGVGKVRLSICGFGTIELAPGSAAIVTCGSVAVRVAHGSATIELPTGAVIDVPDGAVVRVEELATGGPYTVANLGSVPVTVTTDGTPSTIEPGDTTTIGDATAPTATATTSPAPNAAGWWRGNVTVTWNWTDEDGGSGIDTANCPATSTSSGQGSAVVVSGTCRDLAGNSRTETVTVKVDTVAPTVTCPATPTFVLNSAAVLTAAAADGLSGLASPAQASVATHTTGLRSASVTGTDVAGNATTVTCPYRVVYAIQWSYPAGGPGVYHSMDRNTVVTFTFRIVDAAGSPVTNAQVSAPTSVAVACPTGTPVKLRSDAGTATTVNLGSGRWSAGWRADSGFRNTCRRVTIAIDDGTTITTVIRVT